MGRELITSQVVKLFREKAAARRGRLPAKRQQALKHLKQRRDEKLSAQQDRDESDLNEMYVIVTALTVRACLFSERNMAIADSRTNWTDHPLYTIQNPRTDVVRTGSRARDY